MVTKVSFVGPSFTRKPPKYERFIRPTGLRFTKAHVTHPELKCTFNLDIIGVKKNPNGQMYTSLGVITKGTIIEVNNKKNASYVWDVPVVYFILSVCQNIYTFHAKPNICKLTQQLRPTWDTSRVGFVQLKHIILRNTRNQSMFYWREVGWITDSIANIVKFYITVF